MSSLRFVDCGPSGNDPDDTSILYLYSIYTHTAHPPTILIHNRKVDLGFQEEEKARGSVVTITKRREY